MVFIQQIQSFTKILIQVLLMTENNYKKLNFGCSAKTRQQTKANKVK